MAVTALDAIARLARVRERTVLELRQRLATKGFEDAEIDAALRRAEVLGYVDDRRAATALATRMLERGASRALVEDKLVAAGASTALVAELLEKAPSDRSLARSALARRSRGEPLPRERAARFLGALGFDGMLIEEVLED